MKRTAAAAISTLLLGLTLAGCGSSSEPDTPATTAAESPSAPAASSSPTETEEPAPDADASAGDVDALTDADLANISGYAAGNLDDAIARYGAEAVYVTRVHFANTEMIQAGREAGSAILNSDILETGQGVCEQMSEGMTFDEIYMTGYEEIGGLENEDPNFMMANFVWSFILEAPDTICPEHQQAKADWEASAH